MKWDWEMLNFKILKKGMKLEIACPKLFTILHWETGLQLSHCTYVDPNPLKLSGIFTSLIKALKLHFWMDDKYVVVLNLHPLFGPLLGVFHIRHRVLIDSLA